MKVLVAIDGSETALRALRYVVDHRDFFTANPEILLVNVHLPIPSPRAAAVIGSNAVAQYYKDEAEEILLPARTLLAGTSCRVIERPIVGHPAIEIVAAAQKDACDLIVLGTQGRSALGNLIMGSVAMRVIGTSSVPVLSVK